MPFFKINLDLTKLPPGTPTREPTLRGRRLDRFILEARRELWGIMAQRRASKGEYEAAWAIDGLYPYPWNEGYIGRRVA